MVQDWRDTISVAGEANDQGGGRVRREGGVLDMSQKKWAYQPVAVVGREDGVELVREGVAQHSPKEASSKGHDHACHVMPLVEHVWLNWPTATGTPHVQT